VPAVAILVTEVVKPPMYTLPSALTATPLA